MTLRTFLKHVAATCLAVLVLAPSAHAHKASDAHLSIGQPKAASPDTVPLRFSLALKDLDAALDTLDADGDRRLTWGETRAALPAIQGWVAAGVQWRCGTAPRSPNWAMESLEQRSDGVYLRLAASMDCASPSPIALDYELMAAVDPTHRLLLQSELDGRSSAAVLAPGARSTLTLARAGAQADTTPSGWATMTNFFGEGVHHLVTGYDHIAFLLALLLPISLVRRGPSGASGASGASGIGQLLITITGFTLGHSVTLALSTLGWVSASPTWVEPVIAMSIGVSALLNLYPVRGLRTDVLAVAFGLVHGLGFSGVMLEAGVSGPALAWALLGFNLGVEAGQLMMVAAWCVLHLLLARWAHYTTVVVRGGSVALVLLAVYWTVPRLME